MISSYRLGDLVLIWLNEQEQNELLSEHPNSIGSKYILAKRQNNHVDNIGLITQIVLQHMEQVSDYLPKDIENSTVIHLRLGDVVCGTTSHEQGKRPFDINYIKNLLGNNNDKKYVIGKCFFAKPSSTNYEECINASNQYLYNVLQEINAEHFNSNNADIDLCCAIKSRVFVQGRGFYSKLIVEIRKRLNLETIETRCHD